MIKWCFVLWFTTSFLNALRNAFSLLSRVGCVVGLEVLEEVLARVHTVKDVVCEEHKIGAVVHHYKTGRNKNVRYDLVVDLTNNVPNRLLEVLSMWRESSLWRRISRATMLKMSQIWINAPSPYARCVLSSF